MSTQELYLLIIGYTAFAFAFVPSIRLRVRNAARKAGDGE